MTLRTWNLASKFLKQTWMIWKIWLSDNLNEYQASVNNLSGKLDKMDQSRVKKTLKGERKKGLWTSGKYDQSGLFWLICLIKMTNRKYWRATNSLKAQISTLMKTSLERSAWNVKNFCLSSKRRGSRCERIITCMAPCPRFFSGQVSWPKRHQVLWLNYLSFVSSQTKCFIVRIC